MVDVFTYLGEVVADYERGRRLARRMPRGAHPEHASSVEFARLWIGASARARVRLRWCAMPGSSRRFPLLPVVGVTVLLLGGLAACGIGPTQAPSASPSVSAEPIFASDEQALAAAVAAYEAYLAVDREIAADFGVPTDRIKSVATPEYAKTLIDQYEDVRAAGLVFEGETSVDTSKLIEWGQADGETYVRFYVCSDVSRVRVLDAGGADVTPADRDDRLPLIVTTTTSEVAGPILVLNGSEAWTGSDFC